MSAAAVFASFNLGSGASEVVDLSGIALEVAAKLLQGVPPKFLQKSIGEDKCNHGLGCDGSRGHHAPVGALGCSSDSFKEQGTKAFSSSAPCLV